MSSLSRWLLVLIWMGVIFIFSSQRIPWRPESDILNYVLHKLTHLGEYAVLGILLYRALLPNHAVSWRGPALAAAAIAMLYGITDEFHQSFTATRVPSIFDVGYDTLGGIIGVLLYHWRNK